jgi:tetratricopeptide (TPR) repeat protein
MQKNNLMGKILHDLQRFDEARLCYKKALEECDRNPSLGSWRSSLENQLGYVEVRLGNWAAGLEMLRRSIKTTPNVLEFHNRLVKACVLAGDDVGAADAAEAILEYGQMEGLFTRAAALRMRTGQLQQAHGLMVRGLGCFPDSAALRAMQSEALRLSGSHLPEPGCSVQRVETTNNPPGTFHENSAAGALPN